MMNAAVNREKVCLGLGLRDHLGHNDQRPLFPFTETTGTHDTQLAAELAPETNRPIMGEAECQAGCKRLEINENVRVLPPRPPEGCALPKTPPRSELCDFELVFSTVLVLNCVWVFVLIR